MSEFVQTRVANRTGIITLDRPKALNSLSLDMVRDLAEVLEAWRDDVEGDDDRSVPDILKPHVHRALGTGENEWYTPEEFIEAFLHLGGLSARGEVRGLIVDRDLVDLAEVRSTDGCAP